MKYQLIYHSFHCPSAITSLVFSYFLVVVYEFSLYFYGSFDGNPNLCQTGSCASSSNGKKGKSLIVLIITASASALVVVILGILTVLWRSKRRRGGIISFHLFTSFIYFGKNRSLEIPLSKLSFLCSVCCQCFFNGPCWGPTSVWGL